MDEDKLESLRILADNEDYRLSTDDEQCCMWAAEEIERLREHVSRLKKRIKELEDEKENLLGEWSEMME